MKYKCRVSDKQGKISHSIIEADSEEIIRKKLQEEDLFLLSFKVTSGNRKRKRKSLKAVLELTQALSLMIQSGLSLKDSFQVTRELFKKGTATKDLVDQLARSIDKGDSFAKAVEAQGDLFPDLYYGMVQVGQKVGHLEEIFPRLAQWMKESKELRDRVLGALIYPAMILSLVFIGVIALLFFFLPHLEGMMGYGSSESAETLALTFRSAKSLVIIMVSLVLLIPILLTLLPLLSQRSLRMRLFLDKTLLRLPLIGHFFRIREMLSLSFALSILCQCSVPLEEALLEASSVLGNRFLQQRLNTIQQRLLKGESLSSLVDQDKNFPREFSRWISIGERIGKVEGVFLQLKDYYNEEMKKILNRISSLVEPVIILLLGIVLVIIILKVILPLLTLYGAM